MNRQRKNATLLRAVVILTVAILSITMLRSSPAIGQAREALSPPTQGQVASGAPVTPGVFSGGINSLPKALKWMPGDAIRDFPLGDQSQNSPLVFPDAPGVPDSVMQTEMPDAVTPPEFLNPNPNFNGIGFTGSLPPDTNGAIGRNEYIQSVNSQFAIYDRLGNLLAGPTNINQLWVAANSGTACQANNNGDPIVLYDRYADRWVISQFAVPNGFANPPTWQCIAVSQTGDPVNGGWYLYEFQFNFGHDYPKMSVWPDAYYLTSQRGYTGGDLNVMAFDRANMLNGNPATFQVATVGSPAIVLLPSDADWNAPPAGSPAFFARMMDGGLWGGNDRVEVFQFSVDWGNPANSTLSGPTALNTAPFDSGLCAPGSLMEYCIPQPGVGMQNLAGITVWPMFRLQYHNFGAYEAMVFNHTVDADGNGNTGIRWYELRRTPAGAGAWTLFQQGTYAPQQVGAPAWLHRWMGSVAMDKAGNMALGYSVSDNNATFPGIRYAGRLASDPLGLLPHGEVTLMNGTGSQNLVCGGNPCPGRWGDYSDMSLDPVDGCTFWYTQEYGLANGGWATRVGAFRFPTCNQADLSITKVDSPDPVTAGGLLTYSITVTNNGPSQATDVVVSDSLPAGVTYISNTGGCTFANPTLTCNLGDMAPGASIPFDVVVRVSASLIANGTNTLSNTATVSATEFDPDMSDNSATADTIVIEEADLRVTKDCKPDRQGTPWYAGDTATCTIVIENLGPSTAQSVALLDAIVSSGTFNIVSATSTLGVCNFPANPQIGGGDVSCNIGNLSAGAIATIKVVLSADEGQDINDTATVSSITPDPVPGNNVAQDSTTVTPAANLALTKTAAPNPVVAGTDLTYTLQVTNNGPSTAVNVVISDVMPAGVTIQSVSATNGVCNAGVPGNAALPTTCAFNSLADGASETMTIVVHVLPGTRGVLGNNASVSSDTYDGDNDDNLATVAVQVDAMAVLSITKTDLPDPVIAGMILTYEVTISNNGPSTATDVTLSDLLPGGVKLPGLLHIQRLRHLFAAGKSARYAVLRSERPGSGRVCQGDLHRAGEFLGAAWHDSDEHRHCRCAGGRSGDGAGGHAG